jgi:hypothetical protein
VPRAASYGAVRARIGWPGRAIHSFEDTTRVNLLQARPEADADLTRNIVSRRFDGASANTDGMADRTRGTHIVRSPESATRVMFRSDNLRYGHIASPASQSESA